MVGDVRDNTPNMYTLVQTPTGIIFERFFDTLDDVIPIGFANVNIYIF